MNSYPSIWSASIKGLAAALWLCASAAWAGFTPVEGRHFLKLPEQHQAAGEITWLFWPGGKACAAVNEPLIELAANYPTLRLHAVPVVLRPAWRWHAKIWHAAASSPRVAAARATLWQTVQQQPNALTDIDSAAAFLAAHGVADAHKVLLAPVLNQRVADDERLVRQLALTGVPAVRVGRYLTHAGLTANPEQFLATVTFLATQESKAPAAMPDAQPAVAP
ncbi:MAG: DsbA family protein [Gammaproteobacteria bacterium]|nr:DsbA family protein [Gammaproteobacteria bacterium]